MKLKRKLNFDLYFLSAVSITAFSFGVAFNEHHEKWGEKDDDGRQIAIAVGGQNSKEPSAASASGSVCALPIFTCSLVG